MATVSDSPERLLLEAQIGIPDVPDDELACQLGAPTGAVANAISAMSNPVVAVLTGIFICAWIAGIASGGRATLFAAAVEPPNGFVVA